MRPTPSHHPFRRPWRAVLTLPVALLTAALTASGASAVPLPTADGPEAGHRSVPLTAAPHQPSTRMLPGTDTAGDAAPDGPAHTATLTLEEGVHVLGLRWEGAQPEATELRVREPGGTWGSWTALEDAVPTAPSATAVATQDAMDAAATGASGAPVENGDDVVRATTGDVVVGPAEVQVRLVGEAAHPTLEAWTTYRTTSDVQTVANLPVTGDSLVIGTRADWGADESMPRATRPRDLVNDTPKLGVTVHHTAGANNYTAEDVPAIIRGIFHYHGQTLRWDDVGYATLVDKYGRVWEGRAGGVEENVQLAHAFGMNRDWTGVAVLGNHETAQVWASELTALSELTAWTLATHGVRPGTTVRYNNPYEGWTRTLNVVHAHRDVGLTLCPGGQLYSLMGNLLTRVDVDAAEGSDAVQRIGGVDRYAVSARMAQEAFLDGTRSTYLVAGAALSDALGVGAVADAAGAAVLLTRSAAVPPETLATLERLGVRTVTLVGGTVVIPQAIADELTRRGYTVHRVAGKNRFETAAQLATGRRAPGGTVYVADGGGMVDALGGAAAAAEQDGAVVLTRTADLPGATADALTRLAPSRVVVLGGEGSVGAAVVDQISALVPSAAVERIGGRDRYATSALVARDAFDSARSAVAANGLAPVDAMVGTQLAARHDGPVLLTRHACRPSSVDAAYEELGITLSRLAGGTGVLGWSAGDTVC